MREHRAMFRIEERQRTACGAQTVESPTATASQWEVRGTLACGRRRVPYVLTLTPVSDQALRFDVHIDSATIDRVGLVAASSPEEHVFGCGTQFTYFDMKGRKVPMFVSEQGIGRGRQPLTTLVDLVAGAGGSWYTTYAPVPHYLTSTMRSLALSNAEYSEFDLRARDRIRVEVWSNHMQGYWYAGATPLDLVRAHTAIAGRMRALPDWILRGAVVGMQGGTERVREVWQQLVALDAPVAAFWLQDWVGQRETSFGKQLWWNWELDRDRYPDWERLVADMHAAGVRVLTYVNPFLVDVAAKPNARRNLYREAEARGYLVRRADGRPYEILNTTFTAGLLDLSHPEAREWLIGVLQDNVLATGASGWMADFGEGLPYDAVLHEGDPATAHNLYPEWWAALNREAIERAGHGADAVFFTRSGFTRSPAFSTLFWLGDQMVTWDRYDGIKSAVTGLLSSGLSGFAFNHSDIGGYTTIDHPLARYHRSRELLWRWMELAAFQVVFRTHEGNLPEKNHQLYSDPETLRHFVHCARLHQAWRRYRQELVRDAAATGAPVVRPLWLHFADDPRTYAIAYEQFLVGADVLVVPVLDPGRSSVRVYLPRGRWVHLWSGREYTGPADVEVAAPMGQPGVFYRAGSRAGAELQSNIDALPAQGGEGHAVKM